MANKFYSNASQIAADIHTHSQTLTHTLKHSHTHIQRVDPHRITFVLLGKQINCQWVCTSVSWKVFQSFPEHSIVLSLPRPLPPEHPPLKTPHPAVSVWHSSGGGHVHFISAPNSTQFEVFEVKQISGDINLISFCSSFCFMVLRVQVSFSLCMCVCVWVYGLGVFVKRECGCCTLFYKWHVTLKGSI